MSDNGVSITIFVAFERSARKLFGPRCLDAKIVNKMIQHLADATEAYCSLPHSIDDKQANDDCTLKTVTGAQNSTKQGS